jgi:hypothetical protein
MQRVSYIGRGTLTTAYLHKNERKDNYKDELKECIDFIFINCDCSWGLLFIKQAFRKFDHIFICYAIISLLYFFQAVFTIIINNQEVVIIYLQGNIRTIKYEKNSLQLKKRTQVSFRGGKTEVYEILNLGTGKMVAQINRRQFQSEFDFNEFENLFQINDGLSK